MIRFIAAIPVLSGFSSGVGGIMLRVIALLGVAGLISVSTTQSFAAEGDDAAAHAIANKFAGNPEAEKKAAADRKAAAERKAAADAAVRKREAERLARESETRRRAEADRLAQERARADEQEMLANARREADERARDEQQRKAQSKARTEAEDRARVEAARVEATRIEVERQAAAEAARLAEEQRRAEADERARAEAARAAAARAEAERIESARRAADAARIAAERETEARRVTEERRHEEERRAEEEKQARALARDTEARELAEKVNRLRAEREMASNRQNLGAGVPTDLARSTDASGRRTFGETRATVLLLMVPGNRGIRRFERTAEPVLCEGGSCYVSTGSETAALKLTRIAALGAANTLGRRALACRHVLGCIYRDVDIGFAGTSLQPVDLRIMRHDRREIRQAAIDPTCSVDLGRLYCAKPVISETWRAWIVPESVATAAGPEALKAALDAGLPDARSARR